MKRLENLTDNIVYIGAYDDDIDLFESQYIVPEGISYNSYLIFAHYMDLLSQEII